MTKRHNATLDGLRGVAAAAVVWFHITAPISSAVPHRGYLAVDFFFALSGLVLARAYEARLTTNMDILEFIKLRLVRLYPMIFLGTLSGLVSSYFVPITPGISQHLILDLPFGLLLIPFGSATFLKGVYMPLDPPLWSLMFELWANFFYAASSLLRSFRKINYAAIAIGGVMLLHTTLHGHRLFWGFTLYSIQTGLERVLCSFFIGVVLSRLLTPARIQALPSVPFPVLCLMLLAALLPGQRVGALYDVFAIMVIFPAIVALGAKDCIGPTWRPFAILAGALSYPIYTLHYSLVRLLPQFRPTIPTLALDTAAFVAICLVSYAAMRWYDEPLRNWLNRQTLRPPTVGMVEGAS